MPYRVFTVEEANETLPHVRRVLGELRELRGEVDREYGKLQLLDALWGEKLRELENPDHEEWRRRRERISETVRSLQAVAETGLRSRGIRLPAGGLRHGLVDFPTSYRGRWVYLCWHRGEPEVRYWHETDGGFRGRRPISEEQARVMGRNPDREELDDSVLDF